MPSLLLRCLKNPRLWQLALACYWLALFIATHVPVERLVFNPGAKDKYAHVAAFAGLAFLLAMAWRITAGRLHLRQLVWVWTIVVLYGAIEETTQPFVGRTASNIDGVADAIGATLGLIVFSWWSRRWLENYVPTTETADDVGQASRWRRYSLKTLFIAMTVIAVVCYWLMLPTMNAQRFVRAIQQRDYATAESLFIASSDKFPGDYKRSDILETEPRIYSLTWSALWNGERRILVTTRSGDKQGTIRFGATILAYRQGLALHPLMLHMPKPSIKS
jgi:VanZ family protein